MTAAALLAGSTSVLAQVTPPAVLPLAIVDAVGARELHIQGGFVDIDPAGEWVAYTLCDPEKRGTSAGADDRVATEDAAYSSTGCAVWISPTAGGASRNITADLGNAWGPSWSPDGRRLAFFTDSGGAPGLWLWERATDATRKVIADRTRNWLGLELPEWTDTSHLVLKLRAESAGAPSARGAPAAAPDPEQPTVTVLRSPPEAAGPPPAFGEQLRGDIALVDVDRGTALRLLADATPLVPRPSPDGRFLLFATIAPKRDAATVSTTDLQVLDLRSGVTQTIASGLVQGFSGAYSWSPDSRRVAYVTAGRAPENATGTEFSSPAGTNNAGDLFVVDAAGGAEPQPFPGPPEGFKSDFLPPLWDSLSEHVYVVGAGRLWVADVAAGSVASLTHPADFDIQDMVTVARSGLVSTLGTGTMIVSTRHPRTRQHGFAAVDLDGGEVRPLMAADLSIGGVFSAPVISRDGRWVVYQAEGAGAPPDLWIADPGFAAPRRLTSFNPQLDGYTFGASRLIEFRSDDGQPLQASLVLPVGYQEGQRYPLVVWVYASDMGSRAVNRFGLIGIAAYNLQMFNTRGYAVLWPDIPTRTGTPMRDLMKAVMPAIDRAVEMGIADPERLAVMGQSNGGYSTLSLLVQTRRFKAAVVNAGFGDLVGFYGSMADDGSGGWIPWLERLGGGMGVPPWEAPLRYVENSPIFYLDRIEAPLIVQAGGADRGILPFSDQVWVGLQRLGKNATYLRYGGEGHVLAAHANLVDYWQRVLEFFDVYLGGNDAE